MPSPSWAPDPWSTPAVTDTSAGWTRRRFTGRAAAAAGVALLAGDLLNVLAACSNGTPSGGSASPSSSAPGTKTAELEILTSWAAGNSAEALADLLRVYRRTHPGVNVTSTTGAGGPGSGPIPEIAPRLQAGHPPDSIQTRAGEELLATWVKPDRVQPITALWHEAGWDKVFPKGLKEMVSARGEIWAVPLDVHRGNAMWASTRALAAAGGKVPESINDLVTLLDRARGAGIVAPLALGSKGNWQISMLFENSLLAVAGADHHRRLFSGQVSFTEPKVKEALVSLKTILGYANRDHPTLDWDEAAKRLAAGAGAVTFMGDWVKSYFTSLNFVPGRDFAGLPAPGTRGLYLVACDSFAIPRKAADRANAQDWIRACGSVEGQAAFSVRKGSIPPRTDAPKSLFDPIGQQFIDDFRGGVLLRSAALGSASAPVFVAALNGEMGTFAQTGDVNATANNLQRFSAQYLKA